MNDAFDMAMLVAELKRDDRTLPWWRNLSPVRQRVLVNMAFNLGMVGLLTFKNTLGAMQNGSYAAAAAGMLSSKWATQVGVRAERLADMMRTGG
jgi:lysozyme